MISDLYRWVIVLLCFDEYWAFYFLEIYWKKENLRSQRWWWPSVLHDGLHDDASAKFWIMTGLSQREAMPWRWKWNNNRTNSKPPQRQRALKPPKHKPSSNANEHHQRHCSKEAVCQLRPCIMVLSSIVTEDHFYTMVDYRSFCLYFLLVLFLVNGFVSWLYINFNYYSMHFHQIRMSRILDRFKEWGRLILMSGLARQSSHVSCYNSYRRSVRFWITTCM